MSPVFIQKLHIRPPFLLCDPLMLCFQAEYMDSKKITKRLCDAADEAVHMLLAKGGGFSVGLYGMGSKITALDMIEAMLNTIADGEHKDIIVRVRGYDETFPLIRTMSRKLAFMKNRTPRNQKDVIQLVQAMMKSNQNIRMILLIDSIDAVPMRANQKFFSSMALLDNVFICASVDHPTIGLVWSPIQVRAFNWYWVETSTYEPYRKEIANTLNTWENLVEGRVESGSKSISVVLNSLTNNHHDIVRLLAGMQLEQASSTGVRQADLLKMSIKKMIATNLSKLKSLLQELVDHKVVVEQKQKETGNDVYWIPVEKDALQSFSQGTF